MTKSTGFVWHELYMWHDTGTYAGVLPSGNGILEPEENTENTATKRRIKNLLDVAGLTDQLVAIKPRRASDDELQYVHTPSYVEAIKRMSAGPGGDARMDTPYGHTPFGPGGFDIASLAAGGVIGHSYMEAIFNAPRDETGLEYLGQLEAAHGAERALEIISMNRHNTILYPSCSPHTGFQQLRVIRPISVDRTLVEIFTFRLKGTSDRFFQRTINYTNIVNSPSSTVMVDDIEIYQRCQEGMASEGGDWISQHRMAGRDTEVDGGTIGAGISEVPMRNQFKAWSRYMAERF